jgi:chromosome segregation ATPase
MSEWGNALAAGAAAALTSGAQSMDLRIKEDYEMRAADRKLADQERLVAIKEAADIRAEDRKRARAAQMGKEIDTGATGIMREGDASAINAKFGSQIDPNNPDSQASLEAIRKNPEAAQAYGLLADDEIGKSGRRAESARKLGYLDAAKEEDANRRGLEASKAADERGKRDERRMDILEKFQQSQAERQQKLAEATLAHQTRMESAANDRAKAAELAAQRQSTAGALKGVSEDIKSLEKEGASIDTDPNKKKEIDRQLVSLRQEAEGYRRSLAGSGLPAVEAPPAPPKAPPPTAAIDYLKQHPETAAQFEAKYGAKADEFLKPKAKPAGAAPAAEAKPEAKPAAKPAGLLTDEGPPTPAEQLGQKVDGLRAQLRALGPIPPGRMAKELAAYRTRREALVAELQQAEEAYRASLGNVKPAGQ